MGATKSDIFTQDQNEIALIAKAIGHPARIAILQYLLKKNACVCGDIVDEIGLAQATVSQHLKELKQAGLIKGDIDGRKVCYCIDNSKWDIVKDLLFQFFDQKQDTSCC
jgi:DNA-binding transcriptional ArsR family regulator|tara:strand:+ start:2957 stop:3283 length:327 start_codon:yes stop_codon:yes gene_type:complete